MCFCCCFPGADNADKLTGVDTEASTEGVPVWISMTVPSDVIYTQKSHLCKIPPKKCNSLKILDLKFVNVAGCIKK